MNNNETINIRLYKNCRFVTNNFIAIKEFTCKKHDETEICIIHRSEFDSKYVCKTTLREGNDRKSIKDCMLREAIIIVLFISIAYETLTLKEVWRNKSLLDIVL